MPEARADLLPGARTLLLYGTLALTQFIEAP
jgi:hypothetical protein